MTDAVVGESAAQEEDATGVDEVLKEVDLLEGAEEEEKEGEESVENSKDAGNTDDNGADSSAKDEDNKVSVESESETETESIEGEKSAEEIDRIELRQILREQKREIAALKALQTKNIDEDGNRIPSPSEVLQAEIGEIVTERGGMIDLMADSMRGMDKYSDLDSVCSRANLDDIIEVIAKELESSEGADFNSAVLEIEKGIWSMSNPYKYIYDVVKEFHPTYAGKETETGKGKEKETRSATAVKTMQSTQDGSSDGNSKGGWTVARIDNLSEEDLNSVPADVYKKYMRGELN